MFYYISGQGSHKHINPATKEEWPSKLDNRPAPDHIRTGNHLPYTYDQPLTRIVKLVLKIEVNESAHRVPNATFRDAGWFYLSNFSCSSYYLIFTKLTLANVTSAGASDSIYPTLV
jgi:hypothetical protein